MIVDDEPMQIQGLLKHIRWEALGYRTPLTARSGMEALKVLQENKVDVLITDVAMPGMTGIELLARIQADYPQQQSMQTVIISGFDEFEFVQEAIQLGAKAYVLKPVKTEELEQKLEALRTAAEKKKRLEQETALLREKVTESREVLLERFIKDLTGGWIHSDELLDSWRRLLDLPAGEWQATLFLFDCDSLHLHHSHDAKEQILLGEGLQNAVKLGLDGFSGAYIGTAGAGETAVLVLEAVPEVRARLEKQLSFIQEVLHEQYNASVTVGVSREACSWTEIPLLYKEVRHIIADARLAAYGQIAYCDRHLLNEYHDFRLREEYIPEIVRLLELGENSKAFGMGLLSELARKLKRNQDTDTETNIRMWQRLIDCNGVEEVRKAVLEYLAHYTQHKQKEQTTQQHHLIQQVRQHLAAHLQENLTVKQLAGLYHLNSSYLSVLFKKETGQTISEYVQETRMNKAKELLRDPGIKVYEVAEQVGFQTAAYFTFLFKKTTGTTPQEYRDYYY
ncbi:DNA-binding response regulator [Paenibacillus sp. FSL R7-0337]|nr:DNA-binding response regulator [Paenibacillus sp. FSL R7-0337]